MGPIKVSTLVPPLLSVPKLKLTKVEELEMSYTNLKFHTVCQLEEAPPIVTDKNGIRGDLY